MGQDASQKCNYYTSLKLSSMEKPDAQSLLKELILLREAEKIIEGKLLKEHLHRTYESLRPINILKSSVKGIFSAPDLTTNLVNSAIGLTTGFAAKKVFAGKSANPLTKMAGFILEIVVAGAVTKNPEVIKSVGGYILKSIFRKKEPDPEKTT
jgi:hypothetical protein